LVDAGGGSALRFGESGTTVSDLDAVLFSHCTSITPPISPPW